MSSIETPKGPIMEHPIEVRTIIRSSYVINHKDTLP